MENHLGRREKPGGPSRSVRGDGPTWPDVEGTADIVTAPVDPSDPQLRRWFVERMRQLQAQLAEQGVQVGGQRPIPEPAERQ